MRAAERPHSASLLVPALFLFRTIQDALSTCPAESPIFPILTTRVDSGRRHGDANLLGMRWNATLLVLRLCGMRWQRRELGVHTRGKERKRLSAGFRGTIQQSVSQQTASAWLHCPR